MSAGQPRATPTQSFQTPRRSSPSIRFLTLNAPAASSGSNSSVSRRVGSRSTRRIWTTRPIGKTGHGFASSSRRRKRCTSAPSSAEPRAWRPRRARVPSEEESGVDTRRHGADDLHDALSCTVVHCPAHAHSQATFVCARSRLGSNPGVGVCYCIKFIALLFFFT